EIVLEVLPAVAESDVSARGFQKARADAQRKTRAFSPRGENFLARGVMAARRVARARAVEMRREQYIQLQALAPLRVGFDSRPSRRCRRLASRSRSSGAVCRVGQKALRLERSRPWISRAAN